MPPLRVAPERGHVARAPHVDVFFAHAGSILQRREVQHAHDHALSAARSPARAVIRATTSWKVPDMTMPEAFRWPPPPNSAANRCTSSAPLLRSETLTLPPSSSRKRIAILTPSTASTGVVTSEVSTPSAPLASIIARVRPTLATAPPADNARSASARPSRRVYA